MSYILSIDPGGVTGVAFKDADGYKTAAYERDYEVWDLIGPSCELVIYEWFAAEVISKHGLLTVRIIGGIQSLARRYSVKTVRHSPQYRNPYLADSKAMLKQMGKATKGDHEMDALAHLLAWEKSGK